LNFFIPGVARVPQPYPEASSQPHGMMASEILEAVVEW